MKISSVNTDTNLAITRSMDAKNNNNIPEKKEIRTETPPELTKPETVNKAEDDEDEGFDDEVMKQAVDQANKTLAVHDRYIERTVHEVTHAILYTIKDTKTDEIIAEFPPKKIQDMIAKMWELAGLFVDERA